MKTQFIQKRGFNYRKFFLHPDKIVVETKTIRKLDKFEVKMDRIGFDIQYQADNTVGGKILFVFCLGLPLLMTVLQFFPHQKTSFGSLVICYIFGFGIALLNYLKQHQDDIFLLGGQKNLVFYRNIPDEAAVLEFIEQVISTAKQYMKTKYTTFDTYTSEEDFMNRLHWLQDREVITDKEYSEIKEEFIVRRLL
jgi:hypothetical protein